jgi:hypothetical protein
MLSGAVVHNFLVTGFMAVLFIIGFKWLSAMPWMPRGIADIAKNV